MLILGGGVAGLSLACQLKSARPELDIVVAEKADFPAPASAHKVGESTVPIAANYFYEVLGLREHLDQEQLPKLGLRFFGSRDGNVDIARRPELGARRPSPLRSFQLDHGTLENALAAHSEELGVTVLDGMRANDVVIDDDKRVVSFIQREGALCSIEARWLVDASGRAALLKRKLGLDEEAPHRGQAAWFRIADRIAVDDWASDPGWAARVYRKERWRSTVHLHGRGYWVWLIPLASGSTSVGLVADPEYVPFERMRRFDVLLEWLKENEPQLAAEVEKRTDLLQDFRTRKEYPRNARQVFSPQRWFITGDAGIFLDPLYSPGMDYISIANTFITSLIGDDIDGRERMDERLEAADGLFRTMAGINFSAYTDQYKLLGNAEIMAVKLTWDTLVYFTVIAPLAFGHDVIEDPVFGVMPQIEGEVARMVALNIAFRNLVDEWDALAGDEISIGTATACDAVMDEMQLSLLRAKTDEAEIVAHIKRHVDVLDMVFVELVEAVAFGLGRELPDDPDRFASDEGLTAFRLSNLKEIDGVAKEPSTFSSQGGLYWAERTPPEGMTNAHLAAWPHPGGGPVEAMPEVAYPIGSA
ncbi:MAG: tryptophan 7-halogenase [Solirubrobacterales bacterium]